jgi:translation elongation factor EF-1alpha
VGDRIRIQGHTTDFEQKVASIQIEHASVEVAKKGDKIGVKVKKEVSPGRPGVRSRGFLNKTRVPTRETRLHSFTGVAGHSRF